MFTFTEILGGLVILVMLGMAVHEIWLYNHPENQGLTVTPRRLRRRLTGALLVIAMIGAFTLADKLQSPAVKLTLYLGTILCLLLLIGIVFADIRETSRLVVREQLNMSPEELEAMLSDPEVRAALEKLTEVADGEPNDEQRDG